MREQIDDRVANFTNSSAEFSFQLFGSGTERQVSLGADQIDHGLGLSKVHFAIVIGALGKFAAACGACTIR